MEYLLKNPKSSTKFIAFLNNKINLALTKTTN